MRFWSVWIGVVGLAVLTTGGCPVLNAGAALGLQDWGRDLLAIPAGVIIAELIDQAQGTNVPIDRDALYNDLLEELEGAQGQPGVDGKDGENGQDGKDGVDGVDGQDGEDGVDGQDGQDGKDGVDGQDGEDGTDGATGPAGRDGQDGQDGEDGEDFMAVAMGCVENDGTALVGYGFASTKVEETNGVFAVALIGYDFPEGFDPNDLVVLVTADAIVQQQIVTSYDPEVGFGFLVEFRDVWLNRTNTKFCFAVYDASVDPYDIPD